MELSWIQKHILLVLVRTPAARVKDLLPQGVPANQFAYHIDGLVSRRMIVKLSRGVFSLTPQGQKLAGTFSTEIGRQVEDIKTVIMLYGKQGEDYLLFRWQRQPYLGHATPPHERIPRGKSLSDAVNSTLDNKLGVRSPVVFKTSALIKITHDGELISHLNALIYEVSLVDTDFLPQMMRNGEAFLAQPEGVHNILNGVSGFLTRVESEVTPIDSEWWY